MKRIKQIEPSLGKEERKEMLDVLDSGWYTEAKKTRRFENMFAKFVGCKYATAVTSGTTALYVGLKSLGVGKGDEVITTAHSWIATSETISQTGAIPVFVDVDPDYYTINPKLIEAKINKNTRAIIPVHLFGHPAKMTEIMDIGSKYNLKVIEDCAQAHFSQWDGQNVGTIGNAGTFSFFPGKNLGAYGDAGCIITNNDELAVKARMFANHGGLKKHFHEI